MTCLSAMNAGQPLCSLGHLESKWCNKASQSPLSLLITLGSALLVL